MSAVSKQQQQKLYPLFSRKASSSSQIERPHQPELPNGIHTNGLVDDVLSLPVAGPSTPSRPNTPPPCEPSREIITISDSPVRELPPQKTFDDLRRERDLKRTAGGAIASTSRQLPPWPSCEFCHIKSEVDEAPNWPSLPATSTFRRNEWTEACVKPIKIRSSSKSVKDVAYHAKRLAQSHFEANHTARVRLAKPPPRRSDQVWPALYAPARVDDMLGASAKASAEYLREWLEELTLQGEQVLMSSPRRGTKRKIKREVTSKERKKRRKQNRHGFDDDLDDFIADDDDIDGVHYDFFDLGAPPSSSSPSKSVISDDVSTRFDPLSNTILLSGPSASGKTSCVYAVAKELGWQVFEVYPGIGRRGLRDIDRYVGMVGENHIVRRDQKPLKASQSGSSQLSSDSLASNGAAVEGDAILSSSQPSTVQQSLILIEEVDILYQSDQGFWEGLIAFIAKSRRPVVLTCESESNIPRHNLPLQTTLRFDPLRLGHCTPLLEVSSGHQVSQQTPSSSVDLRQALMQLHVSEGLTIPEPNASTLYAQRSHSSARATATSSLDDNKELSVSQMTKAADILSFIDAEISRRAVIQIKDDEGDAFCLEDALAGHSESSDRQLTEGIMTQTILQPLPCYGRETEIEQEIAGCMLPGANDSEMNKFEEKLTMISEEILDCNLKTSHRRDAVMLDIPYLRALVEIDDELEHVFREARALEIEEAVVDTRIRRSRRLAGPVVEYQRYKNIGGELADLIRAEGFSQA